jgi:uncharacterized protein YndB with AHSA1/START domain
MAKENEIVITRVLNAPRKLVFEAFTKPEHLVKWWGPRGFTNTMKETNIKVGGTWRFIMHGYGTDWPNKIVYTDIKENERIAYEHSGDDNPDDISHFNVIITFEDAADNKTKLTMSTIFETKAERDLVVEKFGALEGGNQTIDKLEEQIAKMISEKEYVITKVLNAPRQLVWDAWTKPEHLTKWWGPVGFKLEVIKMELKTGGTFLYCMQTAEGFKMYGKFVYRELAAPERMISVVSFSDENEGFTRHPMSPTWPLETLNEMILTEKDGKTTLTLTSVPINANDEEIKTFNESFAGMDQGFAGTFMQLEEYLGKVQK